ncbi:MAG: transporter substrate-binding domain-containing protein [Candidatus Thiodiazotropha lotti]|nr:transporter substrate-binding domain-containing protein [Candidatus Thiodiazotropha lotti]MCG8008647.1 transporter substrate-binding domain-containing protein [Candidatus Thiodiazotropha lotti]MCW4196236.1 transporter substrate-binding domain-containing protein [Candidatus Thiodiazotropha lotti]MCW4200949.1 transporter substrate-binding domain-containing protein [Candidatus Thiodiazotropha lotti]
MSRPSFLRSAVATFTAIVSLVYLVSLHAAQPSQRSTDLDLTTEETAWLETHPIVDIGVDGSWPPIDFMLDDEHRGIAADYLSLISERLGIEFRIHPGPTFKEMLQKVREGELPLAASVVKNEQRERDLYFTEPFFQTHKAIVTRSSRQGLSDIESLRDKVVAVEDGFSTMRQLQELHPEINLLPVLNTQEALQAVSWKKADAYIGTRAVAQWVIQDQQLVNLHFSGDAGIGSSYQRFAINRDVPLKPLVSAMNKALWSITDAERQEILDRWISIPKSPLADKKLLKLTVEQREWLKQIGKLRVGIDTAWDPIEFVDENGVYQGLSSDYVSYFSRVLNLQTEVKKDLTWQEVMDAARNHQLDLLPALVDTPERREFLNFTQPYLDFPFVIFVGDKQPFVNGLEDFIGRKIGVVKGYVAEEYLKQDYPGIELILVPSAFDGLKRLALSEIDGYVGNLTVGSHLIRKNGLTNIKVGAPTPYHYQLSVGVRKDWPILVEILDQAIRSMTEKQKNEIQQRWMSIRYDVTVDYTTVWRVIGVALSVVLVFVIWLLRLRRKHQLAKQNEAQLNLIINTVPVAIVVSDTKGVIRISNEQSLLEIEAGDSSIIGMNMAGFYADLADRERVLTALKTKREVRNMRIGIRTLKGNLIEGLLSAIPIRMQDEMMHLGVLVNLTERIRVEKEIKKAMNLQRQANRFKSDFLANMSHEIRTPMNAIIGMTHLALDTDLTEKQFDYLSKIKLSSINLLGILNDILDFSKIEAGKLQIEQSEFRLDSILQNLSSLISIKAEQKGLEFIFKQDLSIPQKLIGDPLRIGQVLINLAQNAIKFTAEGEILLSVELEEQSDSDIRVRFSVKDSGIGIEPEKVERLFEAFVQADASTTRRHGGTGLGLSISNNLVRLMAGEISVKSTAGQGSEFSFAIPLKVARKQKASEFVFKDFMRGMKVLVVEDNDTTREVITKTLESFSFSVTAVSSAKEAYAALQAMNDIRLLIMDWRMPEIDGVQAVEHIRKDLDASHSKPIIMITAYDHQDLLMHTDRLGVESVLIKPISPSTLFDTISEVLFGQTKQTQKRDIKSRRFKGQVLLVEDNVINQQVAQELLEKLGLLVVIVSSGEEALKKIKEVNFDLVFMDLQMPGLDGLETTRRVRNELKNTYVRIIAMTAHAMRGDRERCLAAGMDDYLSKPIDPDRLSSTLLAWLPIDDRPLSDIQPVLGQVHAYDLPETVEGIDLKWGTNRVGGNQRLYVKLLLEFQQRYQDSAIQVSDLLRSNERDTLKRLLHTLQGVSGSIGANRLQEATRTLLDAILDPSDEHQITNLIETFEKQVSIVFDSIQILQNKIDEAQIRDGAIEGASTEDVQQLLERTDTALKQGDVTSSGLLEKLTPMVLAQDSSLTDSVNELKTHVDNYDFDKAVTTLLAIKRRLPAVTDDKQE